MDHVPRLAAVLAVGGAVPRLAALQRRGQLCAYDTRVAEHFEHLQASHCGCDASASQLPGFTPPCRTNSKAASQQDGVAAST